MIRIWSHPEAMASSTPYWMIGLSTSGSISLGWALVAGRKRVPRPAAGKTALRTFMVMRLVSRCCPAAPRTDNCKWSGSPLAYWVEGRFKNGELGSSFCAEVKIPTLSHKARQGWDTLDLFCKLEYDKTIRNHRAARMRIVRRRGRRWPELGRHHESIVSLGIESHGAGPLLGFHVFRDTEFLRRFLFDDREHPLAAGREGQVGFLV